MSFEDAKASAKAGFYAKQSEAGEEIGLAFFNVPWRDRLGISFWLLRTAWNLIRTGDLIIHSEALPHSRTRLSNAIRIKG